MRVKNQQKPIFKLFNMNNSYMVLYEGKVRNIVTNPNGEQLHIYI